jgi:hypothetical protein
MNRLHGETYKVKCPFNRGSVFLHVYRDGDRIAHMSLSHQIQDDRPPDERSVMAETLDRISAVMAEAIK